MAKCRKCGDAIPFMDNRYSGLCSKCYTEKERRIHQALDSVNAKRDSAIIDEYRSTGQIADRSNMPKALFDEILDSLILTNGESVPGREVSQVIDIVGAEVAYGLNFFKDIANSMRDLVGGRSDTIQRATSDGRQACLDEIRSKAARLEADAVISVRFEFSQLNLGVGTSGIFLIVATGTAVKLKR
ncbi:YbjQ family protein [Martelella radicis]|uniref:UPF0145 protein GGR30_002095 n=1 Tax=Martelella radicis TaxID=1397476 RepID=A0A7W6KJ25_9HYPH|nr:YbjQ family protein [Martelella radicis]MBB4122166.1 uncharacterized protein YbjQ (UPF0145 family) [Martelella radicis]